jgi:hypothetical protein
MGGPLMLLANLAVRHRPFVQSWLAPLMCSILIMNRPEGPDKLIVLVAFCALSSTMDRVVPMRCRQFVTAAELGAAHQLHRRRLPEMAQRVHALGRRKHDRN